MGAHNLSAVDCVYGWGWWEETGESLGIFGCQPTSRSVNQLDKVRNNRAEHEPSSSGLHARAQSMHILYTQGIGKRKAIMITNRDMVIVRIRKRRFL